MRKIFKTAVASVVTTAMVATLAVGAGNPATEVKADDAVALGTWSFVQGGQYSPGELGNEGYISSVTMNGTNETIGGWLTAGAASVNQTQSATKPSTGFTLGINNTGWDANWATSSFNPWSIQAIMGNVDVVPGHTYTITFDARASVDKYAYVAFACDVPNTPPYGDGDVVTGDKQVIKIGTTDKKYTYTFTNWVSATKISTTLMLGAFTYSVDYAGNNVSDVVTSPEKQWKGTVYVSNFTITDNGLHPDFSPEPEPATKPQQTTTKAPTTKVKKPARVTVKSARNVKGKKIKVTWKKVKNATKYQIKIGSKKKTVKKSKTTYTMKGFKKNKTYKVYVRAYNKAGYGKWSKVKKVKIKK